MQLRELIKEKHDQAENHRFAKYLFSGDITPRIYAEYLHNQYFNYRALESRAKQLGILNGIEGIERANLIKADLEELAVSEPLKKHKCVGSYENYVSELGSEDIMAHLYVRHFGDMFGGAMIKTRVPGSGKMYEFNDRSELIRDVRTRLNADMAKEANVAFGFAIMLFEEMAVEHKIPEASDVL